LTRKIDAAADEGAAMELDAFLADPVFARPVRPPRRPVRSSSQPRRRARAIGGRRSELGGLPRRFSWCARQPPRATLPTRLAP
jgi:hypothetical protein